jgi:uncharacterized repeat protein (TIGR01451 family)
MLVLPAMLVPVAADASSVIRSFGQRYTVTQRGDSLLVGNALLSCNSAVAGCATARANNTSGAASSSNNDWNMVNVDVDGDGATFNSSRASLTLPAGSVVTFAGLYWGADTSAGTNGAGAPTPAARNQVRFATSSAGYTTVTASQVDATGNRYAAFADVTSLVAAAGSGDYTVANLQAGTGQDRYGGWSLVVVIRNASLPLRNLTLFDGYLIINSSAPTSVTTNVSGFLTPPSGAVTTRIGLVAFEGDNGFNGDQFILNSTNLTDALNPSNNVFNSTNTRLGAAQAARLPNYGNQLGFDIDYIDASGILANGASSANLTFTTTSETYFPTVLMFVTDVYEPEIVTNFSKSATDSDGAPFRPGDEVVYTIDVTNTGNDTANNTVVTDPLPVGITYIPGSLEVVSGPNAGPKTDAAGDDQAEYDAGTRRIVFRIGSGADAGNGGAITPVPGADSSTQIRFRVTIDETLAHGTEVSNAATIDYVAGSSGEPGSGSNPPTTFTVERDADLQITKTGPASVATGGNVAYTVTITNLGPEIADGATVTDDVPDALTGVAITCAPSGGAVCPTTTGLTDLLGVAIPTLPSGGSVVFTVTGAAPATATSLSNTATVAPPSGTRDPTPGNNSAGPVVTTVEDQADLSVVKAVATGGPYVAGQNVQYSLTVANAGPQAATNVALSDALPAGTTFVSLSSPAGWTATTPAAGSGGTISATRPTFGAGASETFTLTVQVDADVAPGTNIANSSTLSSDSPDPDTGNNTSTASFTVTASADVSIVKTLLTAGPYSESQTVQYLLAIGNAGPSPATNVTISDTPSNLTIVSVSGACSALPCTIPSLASGATATITVTATIAGPGAFDNSATVTSDLPDPDPSDNTDNAGNGASAQPTADLSVVKTRTSASPAVAGSSVTYTIVVTNAGPSAVAGALVEDTLPSELGGATWTCSPASACGVASGSGNLSLPVTLAAGDSATVVVTATAPTTTPSTIAANTATVSAPAGTTDPDTGDNTSTVPSIPVSARPIDALNDAGSIGGASGGVAIPSVLGNDRFDGASATTGTVVLSLVTPASHPGITFDTANGAVNVAAGTPEGTYTITYRICESANPGNCDDAVATVTITAAALVANPDAGSSNGSSGGVAVPNVLTNDTLNGAPANTTNVVLTQVSSSHPNVTLDPATGAVNVAAGTPAGTYTLTYQICETLNPANCTQTTATATVTAGAIVANDDTAGPVQGNTGGTGVVNVLNNDTLNGVAIDPADVGVTPTSNGPLALNADGTVDVAPNTPAGTYTLTYQLCENLNPANCDTALVTVTVAAAPIQANDDASASINGAAGGTAIASLLGNDTLGGAAATPGSVSISLVSPAANAGVALDTATGQVTVAPGTPAGTYALTYRICEILNPGNCDDAVATVTVTAAPIEANDDTAGPVEGGAGATAIVNVLGNDSLDGAPANTTTVTVTAVTNGPLALNADGTVDVAPNTPAGTYTLTYRICENLNPANCDTAEVTVDVIAPAIVAGNDSASTRQNTPVVIAPLVNDTLDGAPIDPARAVVTQVTPPAHGSVVVNPDGTVTYTPATNYAGPDNFVYRVCDRVNPDVCTDATVAVTVEPNTVDAVDHVATTPQTGPVLIDVIGTTRTGGGAPLDPTSVLIATPPANGTVTVHPNGTVTYTPDTLFIGTDTFTYRICDLSTPTPVCDTATATVTVLAEQAQLRIVKTAPPRAVKVGDLVRYTLVVENVGIAPAQAATLVDMPPAGFTYVDGSLTVDDADDAFVLAGAEPLRISGVDIAVGERATVVYFLRVGAGVGRGTHVNRVSATDGSGNTISNQASAEVRVEGDPLMDDSLILGTVFDDLNGDGVQQPDEPGVPGVRIASVEGLLIETDAHGRYHLVGIDAENTLRGRNFILKVDASTLPPGTSFTTANPLVRRITPGIPVRFDFGVRLPQDAADSSANDQR